MSFSFNKLQENTYKYSALISFGNFPGLTNYSKRSFWRLYINIIKHKNQKKFNPWLIFYVFIYFCNTKKKSYTGKTLKIPPNIRFGGPRKTIITFV